VVCAHGATVIDIDHNHLFYLMARGISEKTARGAADQGFVDEIVEELDNEELIEALETRSSNGLRIMADHGREDRRYDVEAISAGFSDPVARRCTASRWSISTMARRPKSRGR
jgi:hypothetical protein